MGLREALNRQKGITTAVAALITVGAVIAVVKESGGEHIGKLSKSFYSDDDGKTYFVDAADRLVPFDHNGTQAFGAYVYKCSDGSRHVGYLFRYTDNALAKLQSLMPQNGGDVAQQMADVRAAGTQVKRPGDPNWVSTNSKEATALMEIHCPDGGPVIGVTP